MGKLQFAESLGDELSDTVADHVFEARNIGDQVGAQVVTVDGGPELSVLRTLELRVQRAQLGNSLVEFTGGSGGRADEVEGERELR